MLDKNLATRKEKVQAANCKYLVYIFNCTECDSEIRAQSSHLKTHSGKCVSCGQRGIPYKHIYNELKNHKNKKYEVTITFEDFLEIINKRKCHYCNRDIIYNEHTRINGKIVSRAYQLDRVDNNKGYNKDNLVSCCWDCNRIKSDIYTYDEFIKISKVLREIYRNRI